MTIGIVLILVSGLTSVAIHPDGIGSDVVAIAFGVGAAFTLDEFALWLHLRDVYWCPEGRSSIDATIMGLLLAGLILVGTSPFGIGGGGGQSLAIAFSMVAANVGFALISFLKGKLTLGLLGVFVPLVALAGAIRLAKPESLWAKWFYGDAKIAGARARYGSMSWRRRLHDRLDDAIGGLRASVRCVDPGPAQV